MCSWDTTTVLRLSIPANLSHSGIAYEKDVAVDSCIAPLVAALNAAGFRTVASCCGHGSRPGRISLADGRDLLIMSFQEASSIELLWPDIHGEWRTGRESNPRPTRS